jgi:alanine racemase
MNRIGISWEDVDKLPSIMETSKNCSFEGIYSHFAMSDQVTSFTELQIQRFELAIKFLKQKGYDFEYIHMANSGGVIFHTRSHLNMVRLGIILYGLFEGRPLLEMVKLQPILQWKTEIVLLKHVKKGQGISYGHTYTTSSNTYIATVPVGYADGYEQCLYKKGKVIIHDKLYPIAGKVCMDQMMIDVGGTTDLQEGDEVILIGGTEQTSISLYDISHWTGKSIYELMCQIGIRVPRKYINI